MFALAQDAMNIAVEEENEVFPYAYHGVLLWGIFLLTYILLVCAGKLPVLQTTSAMLVVAACMSIYMQKSNYASLPKSSTVATLYADAHRRRVPVARPCHLYLCSIVTSLSLTTLLTEPAQWHKNIIVAFLFMYLAYAYVDMYSSDRVQERTATTSHMDASGDVAHMCDTVICQSMNTWRKPGAARFRAEKRK